MPWRSPTGAVYPPADFVRNLEIGLEAIDWNGFSERRDRIRRERGRLRGIGVSVYVENAGGAPVRVRRRCGSSGAGEVVLHVGTQDFGMGHATVFAQVAADVLGIAPAAVRVVDGDTDLIAAGFGGHGSRCARIGGGAVVAGRPRGGRAGPGARGRAARGGRGRRRVRGRQLRDPRHRSADRAVRGGARRRGARRSRSPPPRPSRPRRRAIPRAASCARSRSTRRPGGSRSCATSWSPTRAACSTR